MTVELHRELNGRYAWGSTYTTFASGLRDLKEMYFEVPSLALNAAMRTSPSAEDSLLTEGNSVREAIVVAPKIGVLYTSVSHILTHSQEAAEAHAKSQEYGLSKKQLDEVLANPTIDLLGRAKRPILTITFDKDPLANSLFGRATPYYGRLLRRKGIKELRFDIEDLERKYASAEEPFARQVFFNGFRKIFNSSISTIKNLNLQARMIGYAPLPGLAR